MKACVIGAGTMGSGIAAHLANLGFQVCLLDVTREAAEACLDRAKKVKPAHFYAPSYAANITLGGIDTDLELVRDCDWVCEAIIEDIDAKRNLYQRLIPLIGPNTLISTNTSSLPLSSLCEGFSDDFQQRFIGTHFFNPPRYLKLLELIPTDKTSPEHLENARKFLEDHVGRRVVIAKDTPGFIANRFGMWSMFHAIHTAERLRFSVEMTDAICGPFLGRPKSAAFRLNDIVGLDVMAFIADIIHERCTDDPAMDVLRHPASLDALIAKGWIGQKAGQGYYRREGKEFLALDLQGHGYRNVQEVNIASLAGFSKLPLGERIRNVLAARDEAGEFLREHLIPVLQYAEYLRPKISNSVEDFDRVMMWGFGWQMGPFQMIDAIGADVLGINKGKYYAGDTQMAPDGSFIPVSHEPQFRTITDYPVVSEHEGFCIRDIEEGVLALSINSKMGVLSPPMLKPMRDWIANHKGPLVVTSEARAFSAGFDIKFVAECIEAKDFDAIDLALQDLQSLAVLLSSRKVVSAVYGYCLGAGLEVAMSCPVMAVHPDAQLGLPESRIGLLPAGAGTARMRLRNQASAQELAEAAGVLVKGAFSSSAGEAQQLRYLKKRDVIISHPDRLITDARALAKSVDTLDTPQWLNLEGPVGGMIDRMLSELQNKGEITDHDKFIGDRIKMVFTKPQSFEEALVRERAEFIELCRASLTLPRIKHMLETGKPLRN